ncbi:MAG TPA: SRPBCC family protein, partial [Isosphaeraceae bacterium]|nr:SRPBCC family protein [Isosphaeraceae bacterium]
CAAIFTFWDAVNAQDIAAVERVQKGLAASAYPGGRMCFRFEESIHRFQNIIIDLMTGTRRTPPGDEDLPTARGDSRSGFSLTESERQAKA